MTSGGTVEVAKCHWGYNERQEKLCRDNREPEAEWGRCYCVAMADAMSGSGRDDG